MNSQWVARPPCPGVVRQRTFPGERPLSRAVSLGARKGVRNTRVSVSAVNINPVNGQFYFPSQLLLTCSITFYFYFSLLNEPQPTCHNNNNKTFMTFAASAPFFAFSLRLSPAPAAVTHGGLLPRPTDEYALIQQLLTETHLSGSIKFSRGDLNWLNLLSLRLSTSFLLTPFLRKLTLDVCHAPVSLPETVSTTSVYLISKTEATFAASTFDACRKRSLTANNRQSASEILVTATNWFRQPLALSSFSVRTNKPTSYFQTWWLLQRFCHTINNKTKNSTINLNKSVNAYMDPTGKRRHIKAPNFFSSCPQFNHSGWKRN